MEPKDHLDGFTLDPFCRRRSDLVRGTCETGCFQDLSNGIGVGVYGGHASRLPRCLPQA